MYAYNNPYDNEILVFLKLCALCCIPVLALTIFVLGLISTAVLVLSGGLVGLAVAGYLHYHRSPPRRLL